MNDLMQLIDNRINRQLKRSTSLNSVPCRILELLPDGNVRVMVVQNNSEYIVPNYSGSGLYVGEEAQLFFQGNISSGRFMYIGASINKQNSSTFNFITGDKMPGEVFDHERIISQINFQCREQTPCLFFFNATVLGNSAGELSIRIYSDERMNSFTPITTLGNDEHRTISFSLSENYDSGYHQLKITACGSGNIVNINTYIIGYQIERYENYDLTNENDYIFRTDENKCGIIYYTGQSKYPEIPTILGGNPVTKLYATSFNYCDIINAYIPEGVEEIE